MTTRELLWGRIKFFRAEKKRGILFTEIFEVHKGKGQYCVQVLKKKRPHQKGDSFFFRTRKTSSSQSGELGGLGGVHQGTGRVICNSFKGCQER